MTNPPTSAAASLYPHLKSGTPEPVQQRPQSGSIADAVYAHLRPPPPKPPNPYLERVTENEWRDYLGLSGLRRKR
jgi:hypothetical protein